VKRFVIDSDDTNIDFLDGFADERETELTQEFDLRVHYAKLDEVIGVYYFDEADRMHSGQITNTTAAGAPAPQIFFQVAPENPTKAISGFAQATYHLIPTVGLTLGYRYSYEDKAGIQHSVRYLVGPPQVNVAGYPFDADVDRRFHGVTPKWAMEWQASPHVMAYASATRGYKSGGYNYAAISDRTLTYYPETVWSYEAGARTDWFERRLRLNLTGFIYDYKDLQLQTILGPGVITIVNAATAKGKGLEAEMSAMPAADWRLSLTLAVLDSTYSSFPDAAVAMGVLPFVESLPEYDAATRSFDARGKQLSFAPKAAGSFTGQRDLSLANGDLLYARADFFVTSRVYYDPSNVVQMSQPAYGLINFFLGHDTANGHWRMQLFVKNLADKGYITGAQGNVVPTGLVGAPRTFGLRVTSSF
jgi:iron complex outermembrane receptor protein